MILSVGQTPLHTTAAQRSGARPQPLLTLHLAAGGRQRRRAVAERATAGLPLMPLAPGSAGARPRLGPAWPRWASTATDLLSRMSRVKGRSGSRELAEVKHYFFFSR